MTRTPEVTAFYDEPTHTVSYVIADTDAKQCAILDSVLDYEPESATVSTESADKIVSFVRERGYTVAWILETHIHADHVSAAQYLQHVLGGVTAIGARITAVQEFFAPVFSDTAFAKEKPAFDRLFADGDTFTIGTLEARVMHTPGHTPADVTYIVGDAVFPGDTLFMPDYGTARVDFPGGSADDLYASVHKLFALPGEMRMFMCHDYLPKGRDTYQWETTVAEQREHNVDIRASVSHDTFVHHRHEKDARLGMPRLIVPSIQINIRGGRVPRDPGSGAPVLKTPVNGLFSKSKELPQGT